MLTTVQCPICQTETRVPATASTATCPQCLKTFSAAGATAPRLPAAVPDQEGHWSTASEGAWANPYGAVAVALAALAILSASLVGVRMVTLVLVILGLLVVALGAVMGKAKRESKDWAWLALGGVLNGLVLLIVLYWPALLNSLWGLDVAANEPGPQQLFVVPLKQPHAPGKLLTAFDWVDATTDTIRQGKVLVRIESVKRGSRDGSTWLQVKLQIFNLGSDVLPIAGFGGDKPVLTDSSGRSFAFHKPLKRKSRVGPPVFEDLADQRVELGPDGWQEYLLLFESPSRVDLLKLEVPASAWGREGRCQFNITGLFRN